MRRDKRDTPKIHVKVDNCTRVNVREYPRSNASVLQIVDKGCSFWVPKHSFENDLYPAVYDSDGKLVGFVMKDYLKEVKEESDGREHTELD